jgi:isoquinoline 1-oxidoreductase beta subunit
MKAPQDSSKKHRKLTRRKFLLGTVALVGGGLGLRWLTRTEPKLATQPGVLEPNAYLQITPHGKFIFQLDRVEMGQGTMTGLTTLIAEELDVNPARFDVRFAPVLSTFQRPAQLTGQSRSLLDGWEILRETGATARAMLLEAAAQHWQTDLSDLSTDDGVVINNKTDERLAYSSFAARAAQLSPPWQAALKPPADYRWIGKHVPRLDAHVKVTGQAVYGIDIAPAGALTAVVARCPELKATLTSFDASAAQQLPGVRGIVALDSGIAVVADNFWTAKKAAEQVQLEWEPGPLAELNDKIILQEQRKRLASADIDSEHIEGDVDFAETAGAMEVQAEYTVPYLAHATMEPMNATVHVRENDCEMWAPTQAPDMARQSICSVTGFSRKQVTVHTTYIGGGFGRRVMNDFITEATIIAKEFAVPVKLVWTREDDMQHGFYRQQSVHQLRGTLDETQRIQWWDHRQIAAGTGDVLTPPFIETMLPENISAEHRRKFGGWLGRKTVDWMGAFQAQEGAKELIYAIPNRRLEQITYNPGVPIGIWRSVGNSYNGFIVESFMDELAAVANQDPLQFRRAKLAENPECLAVLKRVEDESNWGNPQPGRKQGIAIFQSFGTIVAQVAEVSVENDKTIRVHRVCCAVDCGTVVNPDIVRAQMESGIIFGLTAALYGEINLEAGRVVQSNFHDYPMVRMADAPDIDVHIVASDREPSGVGEPGTPVIAPAVANAVYSATGQRLRSLPLTLAG